MSIIIVQNQDIKFVQNQESKPEDPLFQLQYQQEIFERFNISFHKEKKQMLDNFVNFVHQETQKTILILERNFEYLVYSALDLEEIKEEIKSELEEEKSIKQELIEKQPIEQQVTETDVIVKEELETISESEDINIILKSLPNLKINYSTLASVLIIHNILEEIEYLMGAKQQKKFQEEIIKVLQKLKLPSCETLEEIKELLDKNTLVYEQLPNWNQTEIDSLFAEISKTGKKYFGNTMFVDICVDTLKQLPEYKEPEFMNCCMQFVLIGKL